MTRDERLLYQALNDAYDTCIEVSDVVGNIVASEGLDATKEDILRLKKARRFIKWYDKNIIIRNK